MLGTRAQLLHHLFAPSGLEEDERLYQTVEAVGRGCAGAIEQYCDHSFVHAAGRQEEFSADCLFVKLRATPVTALSSVQLLTHYSGQWQDMLATVTQLDATSGLLHFSQQPGDYLHRVRVTYSGGFWIDPTPDRSGTAPEGMTKLPDDIYLAWVTLAQDVWTKRTQQLLSTPDSHLVPRPVEWPPLVTELLSRYRRLAA